MSENRATRDIMPLLEIGESRMDSMIPTRMELMALRANGFARRGHSFTWLRRFLSASRAPVPTRNYELSPLIDEEMMNLMFLPNWRMCLEQFMKIASITEGIYATSPHRTFMDMGCYQADMSNTRDTKHKAVDALSGCKIGNFSPLLEIATYEILFTCVRSDIMLAELVLLVALMNDLYYYVENWESAHPTAWNPPTPELLLHQMKLEDCSDRFFVELDLSKMTYIIQGLLVSEGEMVRYTKNEMGAYALTYLDLYNVANTELGSYSMDNDFQGLHTVSRTFFDYCLVVNSDVHESNRDYIIHKFNRL